MYHFNMKAALLIALLMFGCMPAQAPIKHREKPPMHPIHRHKPRRMVASNPVVVAVIDTGLTVSYFTKEAKLCKNGHKNFTANPDTQSTQYTVDPVPVDNHGHGTNITGLIHTYAGNVDYCLVIVKYYDPKSPYDDNLKNTLKAIKYATSIKAKYINYSGGGIEFNPAERKAVKAFLDAGGKFIAAAGNERSDLAKQPYYPAMDDDRVIVVGSKEADGKVAKYSNFGDRVDRWELGSRREGFGVIESGTSQAAAIATGKIIKNDLSSK